MKERIQEALRRRHRKGDEGFTLIELLVVILIIAILAAVGIVALLSALNSGRKSASKTTLRNAITSVKSAQTGLGQTDYDGITAASMTNEDPDLKWTATDVTDDANHVSISNGTGNEISLATLSSNGICYTARLNTTEASIYGATDVGVGGTCNASLAPTAVASPQGPAGADNTSDGWKL